MTCVRSSKPARTRPPAPLDGFEASVALADRNADELASYAAGAETVRREAADAERLGVREAQLKNRQQQINERQTELRADWMQVWARTGLVAIELDGARDWQRACEDAQASTRTVVEANDQVDVLAQQLAQARTALRGPLAVHSPEIAEDAPLTDLVELAEGLLEHNRQLVSTADERHRALEQAAKEFERAKGGLEQAREKWEQWQAEWPDCCHAAGLPASTDPDQAHELARNITEGLAAKRRIDELQGRIDGIDRDRDRLQTRLRELSLETAPDLSGRESWQAAFVLTERLAEQERRHAKHRDLTDRLAETDAAAAIAQQACDIAEGQIEELCRTAGCETVNELVAIENRYDIAAALELQIRDLEERIVDQGRDSIAALTERTTELDADKAALEIEELGQERERLERQRDELREQIGQAKSRLTDAEDDDRAVDAAQQVQFSQARIIELARQYAIARLSSAMIRMAIDRYRDHNQYPMVLRANELFGRFTEGTYAELFVDADEKGHGYLVARRNNGVIHTMEQMSKGTREQLFLSLRIAAIERYAQQSGPVPIVFDDVFVESDEDRSAQIFAALGELATQTQVIVLTHHRHLIAVAQNTLGDRLNVQELAGARAGLRAAA